MEKAQYINQTHEPKLFKCHTRELWHSTYRLQSLQGKMTGVLWDVKKGKSPYKDRLTAETVDYEKITNSGFLRRSLERSYTQRMEKH